MYPVYLDLMPILSPHHTDEYTLQQESQQFTRHQRLTQAGIKAHRSNKKAPVNMGDVDQAQTEQKPAPVTASLKWCRVPVKG